MWSFGYANIMSFYKASCLATEGKRPRTWLQIRMAEKETRARLVEVENQMTQMVAMMANMKAFILTYWWCYSTIPYVGTSNATETPIEDSVKNKEPVQENPPKTTLEVVNLEEDDQINKTSKIKDEEEAKRLAKIKECLASQGYKFKRFDKFSLYTKVIVPENYKELEFVSKYDGIGCPKSHLKHYFRKMARYSDNTPLLISTF